MNGPEVMISNAAERFDDQGNLKDEKTREVIRKMLRNLVDWTRQLEFGKSARSKTSAA